MYIRLMATWFIYNYQKKEPRKKAVLSILTSKIVYVRVGYFRYNSIHICLPWGISSWKWLIVMSISQHQLSYLSDVKSVIYFFVFYLRVICLLSGLFLFTYSLIHSLIGWLIDLSLAPIMHNVENGQMYLKYLVVFIPQNF